MVSSPKTPKQAAARPADPSWQGTASNMSGDIAEATSAAATPRSNNPFVDKSSEDAARDAANGLTSVYSGTTAATVSRAQSQSTYTTAYARERNRKRAAERVIHTVLQPFDIIKRPFEAARKAWKRRHLLPPTANGRQIPVSVSESTQKLIDERNGKPYRSNITSSAIYSVYDFIPRQLLFQFSKLANVYFLVVSILQMIPSWSTTGNYTTIVPLLVFVSISIIREGYDDYRRHKNDKAENTRRTLVACLDGEGKLTYDNREWRKIKVGDIVRVQQNEWVPADIVLLHSSGFGGKTFIETMALDGETTLKTREAHVDLQEAFTVDDMPSIRDALCVTEDPNLDLYNFDGHFNLGNNRVPLNNGNIIYRGSILRNTASCFGLVVFTGEETKVRLNATENSRSKAPKLQTKVNYIVVMMAIFVILLSVFSTVASNRIQNSKGDNYWYLTDLHVGFVPNFMGFIIMFNTLIPLSLYVSLEISKLFQVFHMQNDIDMYDPVTDTPASCQTATLNEELGQVSYVFSDKTGTLTENIMLFRKMSVAGYPWVHDLDLILEAQEQVEQDSASSVDEASSRKKEYLFHKARALRGPSLDLINQVAALPRRSMGTHHSVAPGRPSRVSRHSGVAGPTPARPSRISGVSAHTTWMSTANPQKPQTTPSTLVLLQYILSHPMTLFSQKAKFFLLALALCHDASPEVDLAEVADGTLEIEYLSYQAASPDELALVAAARDLGFLVVDRQFNTITVRTYPNGFEKDAVDEVYEILDTIEFTSARKRMSNIVKFPDGRLCLFTKGADNVMIERLQSSVLDAAKRKAGEIQKETELRRSIEADMVLSRNSVSAESRGPITGRHSLAVNRDLAFFSIDQHLHEAHNDEMIQESGRRSMQLHKNRSLDLSSSKEASTKHKKNQTMDFGAGPHNGKSVPKTTTPADTSLDSTFEDEQPDDRHVLNNRFVLEKTLEHIDEFSTEGLRTLMYGHRFLTISEYESWKTEFDEARASLVDRQQKLEVVGEKLERDFEITGATAIEDKLQEGVPEAIDKLRRANIRMWMLTGDKGETAINIGYSCRLIKDFSTVVVLKKGNDVNTKILATLDELEQGNVAHCVVVIDGQTLASLETDVALFSLFIDLGLRADSVIVCRASPAQKATMVRQVRKREPNKVMLAIGDGANDIAMIKSADIGIGIAGREGLQAARSSDYSIGQFRFLLKLLLVHGRWNYVRTCKYILGTFYKEFYFYMAQVVFQRNTMFTGTSLYESWSISMFNTLFTSLPVILLGVLDQELSATTLIAVPELYAKGQRNDSFNPPKFIGWLFVAMCQCVMTSFMAYSAWGHNYGLLDNTLYPLGVIVYATVVMVVCAKLTFFEMHYVSIMNVLFALISIGGYLCWNLLIGAIFSTSPTKTYYVSNTFRDGFGRELSFWASIFVMTTICCLFELVVRLARQSAMPKDTDEFEILEKDPYILQRLEQEAQLELSQGWEYQKVLPRGWNAILRGKWPANPMPKKPEAAVTSRRRRRDIVAEKLHIGSGYSKYDQDIQNILERREQELENANAQP